MIKYSLNYAFWFSTTTAPIRTTLRRLFLVFFNKFGLCPLYLGLFRTSYPRHNYSHLLWLCYSFNNLSSIEKLVEQHLKDCMTDILDTHDIILNNHHGSRKLHSTTTALATIYDHTYDKYYDSNHTVLFLMDLLAALNTVDKKIYW